MQSLELLSKQFSAAKSICATSIESKSGRGGCEIEAWFECIRWRCSTKSSEKLYYQQRNGEVLYLKMTAGCLENSLTYVNRSIGNKHASK